MYSKGMKALRVEDMYSTATRLRLKARRSRDTRLPRELTVEHGRDPQHLFQP